MKDDYDLKHLVSEQVDGMVFSTTPRFKSYYLRGNFEPLSVAYLKDFLKSGDTFVDIGAHHGYYSVLASRLVGQSGRVISYEPVPENRQILKKNISDNDAKNIEIHSEAVSNEDDKEASFNIPWASDSAGLHKHPLAQTVKTIKVQLASLDNHIKSKVDFAKIDTEGNEINVLKGMHHTIKNNSNIKLLVEFNPRCLKMASATPEALLKELFNLGFDVYMTNEASLISSMLKEPSDWRKLMAHKEYCNLLCLPQNISVRAELLISNLNELHKWERQASTLKNELNLSQEETKRLEEKLKQVHKELEDHISELTKIYGSRAWKLSVKLQKTSNYFSKASKGSK